MSDATDGGPKGRRVNLYVPVELLDEAKAVNPTLNLSALLQDALRGVTGCAHDDLACAKCGAPLRRAEIVNRSVTGFYLDALGAIGQLVRRGGTAEGAARKVRDVAREWRLPAAEERPAPRPTRAEREAAKVKDFPLRPGPPAARPAGSVTAVGDETASADEAG